MRGFSTTVCGSAVVGLMTTAGMAQFSFSGADYTTPPGPAGLAVGDFDGNGSVDVAATTIDIQASLLFNNGDGSFGDATSYDVGGTGAGHLMAARLNADLDLDLAVVLTDLDQVRIMLNTGDGGFVKGALLNVGAHPTWVIGLKADGDDFIDLAVVNTGAGSVTVLFNNGSGGYPTGKTFPVKGDPRSAASGDFDDDGDIDLAVACRTDRLVQVFSNDGSGSFTFHQSMVVGGQVAPEGIAVGDFDGDDDWDLAATAEVDGANLVAVFLNSGGTFGPPDHYPVAGVDPGAITAADFDGDGNLDLADVNRGSSTVSLFRGNGDGTFGAAQVIGVGENPQRLRAADLNGDDKMDIVTSNLDGSSITALVNTGGGCQADLDGNGALELFDFLSFQNKFNTQDPVADCDHNGAFELFDFTCFVNLFNQGCP